MSDSVSISAYAKLNLSLDITDRRPDGLHTLEMVMQSVDLYDTVTVTASDTIEIDCNADGVPSDSTNIACIAAERFFEFCDIANGGAAIKIKKRIPIVAGLGGGSADAAAVIVALNELYNTKLSTAQMCKIGAKTGSDVPFCICGGTQLAEGTGTILSPLPPLDGCWFVIVKDGQKISTGEMYSKFDSVNSIAHPQTARLVDAVCENDIINIAHYCENVFELLWDSSIAHIKQELCDNGALCAALSGSGPSVFGIFDDEEAAAKCRSRLNEKYDEVFMCEPVPCGCKIN